MKAIFILLIVLNYTEFLNSQMIEVDPELIKNNKNENYKDRIEANINNSFFVVSTPKNIDEDTKLFEKKYSKVSKNGFKIKGCNDNVQTYKKSKLIFSNSSSDYLGSLKIYKIKTSSLIYKKQIKSEINNVQTDVQKLEIALVFYGALCLLLLIGIGLGIYFIVK